MTCTFFGHKDTNNAIASVLRQTLKTLIENENADLFYVGNQGKFDAIVAKELENLKYIYPHINYYIVLAYLPAQKNMTGQKEYNNTIYPKGLENTPPKFAINKRNRWMIDQCDYVITYVQYIVGGAVKYKQMAEKKGKTVINLADLLD